MLQANQLIGTPVIAYDSGEKIGSVKEVIVHRAKKCVVGFIVERTAWFHHLRALPFSEITSFDNSAVLVRSASSVGSPEHIPGGSHLIERKPLVSSTLITGNGHEVGHIDDIYFEDKSGKVSGFDVVVKFADGALSDPKFLPLEDDIHIGPDDVIISEDVVNRLLFEITEVSRVEQTPPAAVLNQRSQEVIHHPAVPDHLVAHAHPVVPAHPVASAHPVVHDRSAALERIVAKPVNPNHLNITRDGSALVIAFECTDMPDDHSIARYREQIFQILAENENCTKLSFDVKNLKVLPSSMLGMMVNMRKKVDNVEIVNPSPVSRDTLRMLKFDRYMTIRDHRL